VGKGVFHFSVEKSKTTRTRKFPILPRVGIVIDVAGRRISYRYAPLLETLRNLIERGLSRSNLEKIQNEQIREIAFPGDAKPRTLDVKATEVRKTEKASGLFKRFRR
jgi:hypothetical protein